MPGPNRSEVALELLLYNLISGAAEAAEGDDPEFTSGMIEEFRDTRVVTYRAAGVMTLNAGLVLRFPTGEEFQLTIKRAR